MGLYYMEGSSDIQYVYRSSLYLYEVSSQMRIQQWWYQSKFNVKSLDH